jgi:hypothetical protein
MEAMAMTEPVHFSDEMEFELKTRIETVRSSIQRSRLAFLALNVVSIGLLLLIWNLYFSWFRFLITPDIDPDTEILKAEIARNWVRSLWTPAGALGVNIGVADTSLLGSLLLSVLGVWFYFAARRENHTTARLLADTLAQTSTIASKAAAAVRRTVFWAVADEHIFLSWATIDKPAGVIFALRERDTPLIEEPDRVVRRALGVMMYLPFLTICVSLGMDIYSLTKPSLFREPGMPLYTQLETWEEWFQVVIIFVASTCLAAFLRYLLRRIGEFNFDTVQQLRNFATRVVEIPDPPMERPKPRRVA